MISINSFLTSIVTVDAVLFCFEFWRFILNHKFDATDPVLHYLRWLLPVSTSLLAPKISLLTDIYLSYINETASECSNLGVDGDVAGLGVRIATWAQVGILLAISFIGTFHRECTGAKEIGAGLALTHVSLAMALLVQLVHEKLTPVNAVIGCMVLDAQNSALSMQLAAKETLAARWQVFIVIVIRALGLIVIGLIMNDLFKYPCEMSECRCLPEIWWTWLSTCNPSPDEKELSQILYASRIIGFFQVSLHSVCNTFRFHEAEPKRGDEGADEQKKGKRVKDITCLQTDADGNPARYGDYPATVSFMYAMNGISAVVSMISVELVLHRLDIKPTADSSSIGQIMALVIAGATISRAIWLFVVRLIMPNFSNFISPFTTREYGIPGETRFQTYILAPRPFRPANAIKLGYILKRPSETGFSPLSGDFEGLEDLVTLAKSNGIRSWCESAIRASLVMRADVGSDGPKAEFFCPSKEYIKRSLQQPEVRGYLDDPESGSEKRVFLVTGIVIATTSFSSKLERSLDAQSGTSSQEANQNDGNERVVIAYKLAAITEKENEDFHVDTSTANTDICRFVELMRP